jgi:hypothetical protein
VTLGLAENLVDDPIAMEAQRAAAHFNYDPQATYIVLTPPGTIGTGQPVYCGYHTQTTSLDGLGNPFRLQYSFIPFLRPSTPARTAAPSPASDARTRGGPGRPGPHAQNQPTEPL